MSRTSARLVNSQDRYPNEAMHDRSRFHSSQYVTDAEVSREDFQIQNTNRVTETFVHQVDDHAEIKALSDAVNMWKCGTPPTTMPLAVLRTHRTGCNPTPVPHRTR